MLFAWIVVKITPHGLVDDLVKFSFYFSLCSGWWLGAAT
jgi:hypothetical protein